MKSKDITECPVCHEKWMEGDTIAYAFRDGYMIPTHVRCAVGISEQQEADRRSELIAAAKRFRERLIERQQDMPPEFAKVLQDEFWNLI